MKILKLQTEGTGAVFYQVISVNESTYTIKALCRIRKGFLTIRYKNTQEFHLYKSEVGVNYLEATKKELKRIKEILDESAEVISQAG
ncbi:MAG: hypothetical protein HN580_09645 [Deltaproteobacteria bacterium]|jgi:hypothetical protein|nr:hypothetical protein [Deltaproteobacteria bacterium]MBT4642149.1 hypothetical protein [Deltaproteobacteria bacterium]MBT6499875.1 hypothetical protein [Deltaproteobacteria bacterium]MBT6615656.1 hypothetical protein [Deltaproteobacteria bacterium]MBT7154945.1 hypothetical protein [Deltaproteobacteria bacterium]